MKLLSITPAARKSSLWLRLSLLSSISHHRHLHLPFLRSCTTPYLQIQQHQCQPQLPPKSWQLSWSTSTPPASLYIYYSSSSAYLLLLLLFLLYPSSSASSWRLIALQSTTSNYNHSLFSSNPLPIVSHHLPAKFLHLLIVEIVTCTIPVPLRAWTQVSGSSSAARAVLC